MTETPTEAEEHVGPVRWAFLVIGWIVIGYAIYAALFRASINPIHLFRLVVGLDVVNDALAVPLVFGISVLVRRFSPKWLLVPAQVGLIISAVVTLFAYPLLGDYGHSVRAGSSRLPFNYAHNLLIVLGAIWLCCALAAWRNQRRSASAE
jgi:hypothetical protein